MKHGERAFIYTGLALCLALGAGVRLGGPTAGAAPAIIEPKPVKIATIDLGKLVVDHFLLTDAFKVARDVQQGRMKPLQDQLLGMKTRLEQMSNQSPEFQKEYPEYQNKVKELQKLEGEFNAFQAQQVAQAAKEAAAAARKVADAMGYSHVFVSRTAGQDFRGQVPDAVLSEALQQTVLVGEPGTDITGEVRKEMKIPDAPLSVTPVGPVGPAGPGASAPPAGGGAPK